jgi:hypothetical protein
MSSSQEIESKRFGSLGLAFIILAVSVVLTTVLVMNKPRRGHFNGIKQNIPHVEVQAIERRNNPVFVSTFGSVKAEKMVTLRASLAGKILESEDLYPGKTLYPSTVLFSIEKTKIDLAIRSLELNIKELEVNESKLIEQEDILILRLANANELYKIAEGSHDEQKSILEIEGQIFANAQELLKGESISNTEFLKRKTSFQKAEVTFLEAKRQMQNSLDSIHRLELDYTAAQQQILLIENKREAFKISMEELFEDRSKSDVKVDFPAKVVEVLADSGQEVNIGTDLARVRSFEAVEIIVTLPDTHFEWLYRGNLLKSTVETPFETLIDVHLVNYDFQKTFKGAYIKSISGNINVPTRSLPIVIAYNNPTDENGELISREELIPGMYCTVRLELCKLKNTFLIPPDSIQPNHKILHVTLNETSEHTEVAVIENFEILYDGDEGVIVSIGEDTEHLLLITHELKDVETGDPVYINNWENV